MKRIIKSHKTYETFSLLAERRYHCHRLEVFIIIFHVFMLQIPQMVLLTFDGAVNHNNYDRYLKVLGGRYANPNGCPIRGTFFISHEYR